MAIPKWKAWVEPDKLILLEGWARDGLTNEQLAHNMGITVSTLYEWQKNHSEISEALKKGKEVVDILVENALLKRALGYEYEEERYEFEAGICVKKTVIKKHMPGDTTAQIYWLKNRKPDAWREKREYVETEEEGSMGGVIQIAPIADSNGE